MKKKNLYKKGLFIKPVLIAAFVIIAGIIALRAGYGKNETAGDDDTFVISQETTGQETQESLTDTSVARSVVYICGKVAKPGLYECEADTRVADVVEMAGGLLDDADDSIVNMAAKVSDGQQIVISGKGEASGTQQEEVVSSSGQVQSGSGLVNINTADEAALKSLPGIGEQKAKAIISYRQESGSFSRIEDIMKVSGIKDGAFSKIKDLITV